MTINSKRYTTWKRPSTLFYSRTRPYPRPHTLTRTTPLTWTTTTPNPYTHKRSPQSRLHHRPKWTLLATPTRNISTNFNTTVALILAMASWIWIIKCPWITWYNNWKKFYRPHLRPYPLLRPYLRRQCSYHHRSRQLHKHSRLRPSTPTSNLFCHKRQHRHIKPCTRLKTYFSTTLCTIVCFLTAYVDPRPCSTTERPNPSRCSSKGVHWPHVNCHCNSSSSKIARPANSKSSTPTKKGRLLLSML